MTGPLASSQRFCNLSREVGFSLVELVVVLVLMGIVSATVLPRLGNTGFDERGFRDAVISGLHYAQKSAVAAHRTVCATFTSSTVVFRRSTTYGATDCTVGVALEGPDGDPFTVKARGAATFSPVPADIVFDAAGRPITGAVSLGFSGLPATLAVTLEAETGYAH